MKITNSAIWLVGALIALIIVAATVISVTSNSDIETLFRFLTNTVAPLVGIIITGLVIGQKQDVLTQKVDQHAQQLDTIEANTNGALSALIERLPPEVSNIDATITPKHEEK